MQKQNKQEQWEIEFEKQFGRLKDLVMNEYIDVEDAEHLEREIFNFIAQSRQEAVEEAYRTMASRINSHGFIGLMTGKYELKEKSLSKEDK